jgi:hypothetical protein
MAVLHDTRADGKVQFVQRGFLRASHRTLDEARSTTAAPVHRHDRALPLEPGKDTEVQIVLLPVGHVFRRGHRIELVVTSPPPTQMTRDVWGFAALPDAALNTVRFGGEKPSRLVLPWLPGATAEAELAPCGTLANQPCRDVSLPAPVDIIDRYERRGAAGAGSGADSDRPRR